MIRLFACQESKKGMHYEGNFGDLLKVIWHDGQGEAVRRQRWSTTFDDRSRIRAVILQVNAESGIVILPLNPVTPAVPLSSLWLILWLPSPACEQWTG